MNTQFLALPVVGAGLVALLAGLVHLQWVFGEERLEAIAAIDQQRLTGAELARREVLEQLASTRATAERRLDTLRGDGVDRPNDVLLAIRGERVLPPRPPRPGAGRITELLDPGLLNSQEGGPQLEDEVERERWRRVKLLSASVELGDVDAAKKATAMLLAHLSEHRGDVAFDAATTLLMLEAATAADLLPSPVAQQLLLSGLRPPRSNEAVGIPPLLPLLSQQRHQLHRDDLDLVLNRLQAVGARHRVSIAPLAKTLGQKAVPFPAQAAAVTSEVLVRDAGRTWWCWRLGEQVQGVLLDEDTLLLEVANSLSSQKLLPADAALSLEGKTLAGMVINLRSSSYVEAAELAERRFAQKTGLAITCALLAMIAMGLAALMIRRRQALVALKSDFVATVSHELRTPLSAIRLLAETLQRKPTDADRARTYSGKIVQQVDRLGFLVENLLSFNRVDKGRWALRPERVDLHALIGELADELTESIPGAVVDNAVPPGMEVVADPELLRLLFSNLIRNGLVYNASVPAKVTVSQAGDRGLQVRDNGLGVPHDDRERIFEPFVRSSDPRTAAKKGTGLGLGLCRRIVALHRGELTLQASGAEGSTFVVRLGVLPD